MMAVGQDPAREPSSAVAIVAVPFQRSVMTWETREPLETLDPALAANAENMFSLITPWVNSEALEALKSALSAGDERAKAELVELHAILEQAVDFLNMRCTHWKQVEQWGVLREEARFGELAATMAGRSADRSVFLFLRASALRALGDHSGAVRAYNDLIALATKLKNDHLLSVAHDNLGNLLVEEGHLDHALQHYQAALAKEKDPDGRFAIRSNSANALVLLGELHKAQKIQQENLSELENGNVTGSKLAIAIDNAANVMMHLGNAKLALEYLHRATAQFDKNDESGLIVNALSLAGVYSALGQQADSAKWFDEAHDRVFRLMMSRLDPNHYRQGYLRARTNRIPETDEVMMRFIRGVMAKDAQQWPSALSDFAFVSKKAREAQDYELALRSDANAAAIFFEMGRLDQAIALARNVQHQAGQFGLALAEHMASGTLASMAASGAEIRDPLGALGVLARALALRETHVAIVSELNEAGSDDPMESYDLGIIENELGLLATRHFADDLATQYMEIAASKARALGADFPLLNRLAGLRLLYARQGQEAAANDVAAELEALVAQEDRSIRSRLVGHAALGAHYAKLAPTEGTRHLKSACGLLESLRKRVPPGAQRSAVMRQFGGLHKRLARALFESGDLVGAFHALQGEKGRRIVDLLAFRAAQSDAFEDNVPTAVEVMAMLRRFNMPGHSVLVDCAVYEDGVSAYVLSEKGIKAVFVAGDTNELTASQGADVRERERQIADLCMHNDLLCDLAKKVMAVVPKKARLLIAPDDFLHNFPLHIIPVNDKAWCQQVAIGFIPAAGMLKFSPADNSRTGRCLVAGDSRGDLPYANAECVYVAAAVNTRPLLGLECTRSAVEAALQQGDFDIVHLAVHGRGDVRRGGRGSLLLADGTGGTEWVLFEELCQLEWQAELVVLSGCSTGVSGPVHGHEMVGAARAAVEAGASCVVASLWPVGDEVAFYLMRQFYDEFLKKRNTGAVDVRVVMDHARESLRRALAEHLRAYASRRDGGSTVPSDQVLSANQEALLSWAPFVVMGDPIVGR